MRACVRIYLRLERDALHERLLGVQRQTQILVILHQIVRRRRGHAADDATNETARDDDAAALTSGRRLAELVVSRDERWHRSRHSAERRWLDVVVFVFGLRTLRRH